MKPSETVRLQHIAFVLPEWRRSNLFHQAALSVSLDAKAVATVYHTPLALIDCRDNYGKILTFFMDFIKDDVKESFAWFLRSFLEAYVVAPKPLGYDQVQAILND